MKLILSSAIVLLFLFSACKDEVTGSDSGTPPANEVWMSNNSFTPGSLTVAKGTTVKWTNKDGVTHTVTSSSGPVSFDSGNMSRDQAFSFKFDSSGTYSYFCRLHSGMTGSITVQ